MQKLLITYKSWQEFIPHLPKSVRYTLGEKIDTCLLDAAELIFSASYAPFGSRFPIVRNAETKIDLVKFFLQIAWEAKALDGKKYIAISEKLDEVGRMLGGWLKQLSLKETPPK